MLRFSDFSHLPEVDELLRQILAEPNGLVVVAGLDSRPAGTDLSSENPSDPRFLPSGRATIFRVLVSEVLDAHPKGRCCVVTEDKDVLHVARRFRNRIEMSLVKPPLTYADVLDHLATQKPEFLVVDRIAPENLRPLLALARDRTRVVSQIDTILHAQAVAQSLGGLGPSAEELAALRWIVTVQRLPTLCPICKKPADVTQEQLAILEIMARRFPSLGAIHAPEGGGAFYTAQGCDQCRYTGRQGDVSAFDFYRVPETGDFWAAASALPMAAYVWMLAQRGQVALTDALEFEDHQMRRTYNLLTAEERQLAETRAALERKTVELDTANRLLKQRTRELVSLEGIGQALLTWSDLRELGGRVLKAAMEVSKADRGIIYYVRSAEWGQILASLGWQEAQDELGLARNLIYEKLSDRNSMEYAGPPPGLQLAAESPPVRSGHAIPLVAHGIPAGLMLIQSTRKPRFSPGEVALLQTLAGYGAIAMQRAGLIEQLQIKIEALEAAQEELAQKGRLEREMELARQVQLSMLPRTFPDVPGLTFAAGYAPARQVGGDFYDVIQLDENRVGLVIADVADKGMPAALYMALARSLILAEARRSDAPATVLRHVNRLLVELGERDMFVTVFYGVLDHQRRRLIYARAGHDRPLVIRDGAIFHLGGRGIALGLFDDGEFFISEEELEVLAGDRLVLYTDGLADTVGPGDVMLGSDALEDLLRERANLTPEGMCAELFSELATYRQSVPQFDDMALVVVGVQP